MSTPCYFKGKCEKSCFRYMDDCDGISEDLDDDLEE